MLQEFAYFMKYALIHLCAVIEPRKAAFNLVCINQPCVKSGAKHVRKGVFVCVASWIIIGCRWNPNT